MSYPLLCLGCKCRHGIAASCTFCGGQLALPPGVGELSEVLDGFGELSELELILVRAKLRRAVRDVLRARRSAA